MLSLTKKTEYALISLGYLAERPGKTVAAREVAEAYHMPGPLVMNILKTLHHAGLISSTRGTKGGYRLTADLREVSLHRLVEAIEGPVYLTECVAPAQPTPCPPDGQGVCERPGCRVRGCCPIMGPVRALHNRFVGLLQEVKVADLVVNGRKIEVPADTLESGAAQLAAAGV
jgi:Rrf2 family protein